jgi:hypothetical protein
VKVYTVQGTLNGVASMNAGLPGIVAEALRLHGAQDPAVVLYEEDRELGCVFQWAGRTYEEVTEDVAQTIDCLISALFGPEVKKGAWYVDEEGEMPSSWSSLLRELGGLADCLRGRKNDRCVCSLPGGRRSNRWFKTRPSTPHGLA